MRTIRSDLFLGGKQQTYSVTIQIRKWTKGSVTVKANGPVAAKILACEKLGLQWYEYVNVIEVVRT